MVFKTIIKSGVVMLTNRKEIVISIISFLGVLIIVFAVFGFNNKNRSRVYINSEGETIAVGQCATCHTTATPGIVNQWADGKMVTEGVTCIDCHNADKLKQYGTSEDIEKNLISHNGYEIINKPTPANCNECHNKQVTEFTRSGHAGKSWLSVVGSDAFTETQLKMIKLHHPEKFKKGDFVKHNGLAAVEASQIEGDFAIRLSCKRCHGIGAPNPDMSIGNCSDCHLRHNFSIAQAREPKTCGQCHIGPDHPQIEIWEESSHGVVFRNRADKYNLDKSNKDMRVQDQDAPTCATCHMAGFKGSGFTHDVNSRSAWHLHSSFSTARPGWKIARASMENTCLSCHDEEFVKRHFYNCDKSVQDVNVKNNKGKFWANVLMDTGNRTKAAFDEEIDFVIFDLWHHWGRTAKFGTFMLGADYVQWHGNYELQRDYSHLMDFTKEKIGKEKFIDLKDILDNNKAELLSKYFSGDQLKKYQQILTEIYDYDKIYNDTPLGKDYLEVNVDKNHLEKKQL